MCVNALFFLQIFTEVKRVANSHKRSDQIWSAVAFPLRQTFACSVKHKSLFIKIREIEFMTDVVWISFPNSVRLWSIRLINLAFNHAFLWWVSKETKPGALNPLICRNWRPLVSAGLLTPVNARSRQHKSIFIPSATGFNRLSWFIVFAAGC